MSKISVKVAENRLNKHCIDMGYENADFFPNVYFNDEVRYRLEMNGELFNVVCNLSTGKVYEVR